MTRFVASYGMGADSTAELLEWERNPARRPCAWEDLTVITAQTGDEWAKTGRLVQQYMVPFFQRNGIRWVQVARHGPRQEDGITVLEDSRNPQQVHLRGDYRLIQEMISNGTVPQTGGHRRCSLKAKGWVLDTFLAQDMAGEDYLQFVGFEKDEWRRAVRDTKCNTPLRTGMYPLLDWGWTREKCEQVIYDVFGVWWPKSCCTYCPFALQSKDGRRRTLDGYENEPETGLDGLIMEHLAVSLNHRQGLNAGRRLVDLLAAAPGQERTLALFYAQLEASLWSVYEVQRAITEDSKGKPHYVRNLRTLMTGARDEARAALAAMGVTCAEDGIPRVWLRERDPYRLPTADWCYVAAPVGADDKKGPGFDEAWEVALTGPSIAQPSLI